MAGATASVMVSFLYRPPRWDGKEVGLGWIAVCGGGGGRAFLSMQF